MADHGVVCSMSRSRNVWDNAAMESFFSSLKTERTAQGVPVVECVDAAKQPGAELSPQLEPDLKG